MPAKSSAKSSKAPPSRSYYSWKFATLSELVSSGEFGPEVAGRPGYVYGILLEGNCITASAYPAPGEQLPALYTQVARLQPGR
jgi:hypothetical protein